MRTHKNLKGIDYHGTCPDTGKRQYSSRGHARKARQIHSHTRGTPYRCEHCGYFHIGHYKTQRTRDGYRGPGPRRPDVEAIAAELNVSPGAVRKALEGLSLTPNDEQSLAEALRRLRALTYRTP